MKKLLIKHTSIAFIILGVFAIAAISFLSQCSEKSQSPVSPENEEQPINLSRSNPQVQEIMKIQNQNSKKLFSIPGVVGMGTGKGKNKNKLVIRVYKIDKDVTGIPETIDGYPVEEEVTGMFKALSDLTIRYPRPAPIGVSTGHPDVTAGTIGCRVRDNQGNVYALSNNHVFAASNQGNIGDNVLQPGIYDDGTDPADAIGTLFDFEPVNFDGGDNLFDAAIVLVTPNTLGFTTVSDGYGFPNSFTVPYELGQAVQKFGRTTGWTLGTVSEINVTVTVCYECLDPFCWSCPKKATFVNQIAITPGDFAAGGDSGSLIITDDENRNPVALLFAASPAKTIGNPIDPVLQRFNVTIDDGGGINNPPHAAFNFTTSELTAFYSDISSDSDGEVVSWNWDLGDGSTSTEQNPSHTYSANGFYTVALTVLDEAGASSSFSQSILAGDMPNNPPVADFTYNASGLTATFIDHSTDSDGSIISYDWDFGDGATSSEQNPVHTYPETGYYTAVLTVTDDDGESSESSKSVYVNESSINDPPIANFSYSVSGLMVMFNDLSTDPDGNVIIWNWDFGDGETSPYQNPTHTFNAGGTYTVTLTVKDNGLATNSMSQDITVTEVVKLPPVADFTCSASNLQVTFTDQSSDSDGRIIAWSWNFGDGTTSPFQNPTHTFPASGTYTVSLTVTDNDLLTGTISQEINTDEPSGNSPVADFSFSVSGLTATFSDLSTDPDGHIIAWNWNFGDGGTSPFQNPTHTFPSTGTYTVTLTVTDNSLATNSTSQYVTVTQEVNQPPTADFTYSVSDLTVSFSSLSFDPDGNIIAYNWNFGDGGTSPFQNPTHLFPATGTYTVTLTVTDNDLATNSTNQDISVIEEVNQPPFADFTYSISDMTVSFSSLSSDPDGNIIGYDWDFGDGATSPFQNPSHTYFMGGTYLVTLTVTDNELAENSASQFLTITQEVNEPPVADFSYSSSDLMVTFNDLSSDPDGTITNWYWDFGDGITSPYQNPTHTFSADGTYHITLTVTDNDNESDDYSEDITVSVGHEIILSATGITERGRNQVDLSWNGATTSKVDIYRNNVFLVTTRNDGAYTDNLGKTTGLFVYKIREQGTSNWSNETTVVF
jgi:PKD repeat protein